MTLEGKASIGAKAISCDVGKGYIVHVEASAYAH